MPKQILATLKVFNRFIINDNISDQKREIAINHLKDNILNTVRKTSDEEILNAIIIDIKDWPL
jgi:hypothetical protein